MLAVVFQIAPVVSISSETNAEFSGFSKQTLRIAGKKENSTNKIYLDISIRSLYKAIVSVREEREAMPDAPPPNLRSFCLIGLDIPSAAPQGAAKARHFCYHP